MHRPQTSPWFAIAYIITLRTYMFGLLPQPRPAAYSRMAAPSGWLAGCSRLQVYTGTPANSPLCANMTSPIKPEVHSISQRRQRRTERRTSVTSIKNLAKIGHAVPEICSRTEKRTDRQTRSSQYFDSITRGRRKNGYAQKRSCLSSWSQS